MVVTVGNLIPCPRDLGSVACAVCAEEMVLDPRGNYLIEMPGPSFLCDACGRRERPSLMRVLHRLRHTTNFTPTIGASASRVCPLCAELVENDLVRGWHIVSVTTGAPVCDSCCEDIDPAIVGLLSILQRLHRADMVARRETRCIL